MKSITKKINKGTGAGGSNTTKNGLKFENITDMTEFIINNNYHKVNLNKSKFYFQNDLNDDIINSIQFIHQKNIKLFFKIIYGIEMFRIPDAMFIIDYKHKNSKIIIIEKKNQNVDGSVETKLWSALALKKEYILFLPNFDIEYLFCVNDWLFEKINSSHIKYKILRIILKDDNIKVLNGEYKKYFETLYNLIIHYY